MEIPQEQEHVVASPDTPVIPPPVSNLEPGVPQKPSLLVRVRAYISLHRPLFGVVGIAILIFCTMMLLEQGDERVALKKFTNVYSFVPEKISRSAPIPISLPSGVDEMEARTSITFSPDVEGEWQQEEENQLLIFKPSKALRAGVYYAVNLDTPSVQMSGDFYVDEDPKISAILPGPGSETNEETEITFMFNRPMVPLTTLSLQEEISLPISITPETKGKFKWISTRTLQFIPETTLLPSSAYTVSVSEGLSSIDGLSIEPMTHTFYTRPLRYEYVSDGTLSFRSPIIIAFNQPIDLDKTISQITVERQGGGSVPIEAEFGVSTYYDEDGREVTEVNPAVLYVYQKKDTNGRSRLWDFETNYTVSVRGAVPKEGTDPLTESRTGHISVSTVVDRVEATSPRSSYVRQDFFDPQGELLVYFGEAIDKDRSRFEATGLKEVRYGERCKELKDGEEYRSSGDGCEKEPDYRVLRFSFNDATFPKDEPVTLMLERVVTEDGLKVNTAPIPLSIKRYPALSILRTIPDTGATNAALDELFVCSTAPLQDPGEAGLAQYLHADGYMVYGRWSPSSYISEKYDWNTCEKNEYETRIQYGIHPEKEYQVQLSLTDEFGGTANKDLSFKTRPAESRYTRFHNLQKQYNVTTPTRTKLTYAVENLEYVDLHICKMSPEAFLEAVTIRTGEASPPSGNNCTEVRTERVELPSVYWVNNYFQIQLTDYFTDAKGHYIVTMSNPLLKDEYSGLQRYDRTYVSVTNLSVGSKEVEHYDSPWTDEESRGVTSGVLDAALKEQHNLFWVINNATLAPVVGAMVTPYTGGEISYNKTYPFVAHQSSFTNGEGIAETPVLGNVAGAVVRSGADSAVITNWSDTLYSSWYAEDASRTYIYTDRPIYRPSQTVYIRGIDRVGFDGSYSVWNKDQVQLTIFDAQDTKVYETALSVSSYGTFESEFSIPLDAPLGTYRIEVLGNSSYFSVEEYVPSAFKLEASTDKEEYTNGDTITVDVQADYYFGVPVDGGSVSYSVTAQDYYFDRYTDEYFTFGNSWYYCYYCDYGDEYLFRGETSFSDSGRARIERTFDFVDYFSESEDAGSKLVTITLTAKDSGGRSVSLQKSFIVHKGEFYIGARTDEYYTSVGTPLTFRAKSVDQKGSPIALSGIERIVSSVSWDTFKRQEVDGGFYWRSEKRLTEVSRGTIRTDGDGNFVDTLMLPKEGSYEIELRKTDNRGNVIQSTITTYVFGDDSVVTPPSNNYELEIESQRTQYEVGDMASVLLKFPYDRGKVLITTERGAVYEYWIADVSGGLYYHEFPITSEYAPNVHVSALLVSPDPEVKFGSVEFTVDRDEHELLIEVSSDKTEYLPGEEVTLSVHTTDHLGKPAPAEVSIAVADLSVLALKGNPKKNPLVFFYDGFPLSVTTGSNLKNILHEMDIPLGTKGGGGDPDDLAKKKRGVFKDTAFWEGNVVTDASGNATISFTLPDNLTTWQVETLGVTEDTKVGVDYREFVTGKKLMVVPLKPRFVVPGDTFSIGAKVFNETDRRVRTEVRIESGTLELLGETTGAVSIAPGETDTVYFEVRAPEGKRAGEHVFTITADGEDLVDSVEQSITITPNTTYETVATANMTKEDNAQEFVYIPEEVVGGEGGLTINANATLAVFMTDALTYMATYPYGCSEQLASALSTIAILQQALAVPGVEGTFETIEFEGTTYSVNDAILKGLSQIYANQSWEGGFSYYQGTDVDLYLTMHVVTALAKLQAAGYEIRTDVLNRALTYIETESYEQYRHFSSGDREMVILAEYTLRTVGKREETKLTALVESFIDDAAFLNEDASNLALGYLSILTTDGFGWFDKKKVYEVLQNRIDIDGRGAYLKNPSTISSNYYHSTIADTALLLKVFAAREDEHASLPNVLRWLLASRDARGVWGSTHNTFLVIDAMVSYLSWQHETESHFTLRGALDGKDLFSHEFKTENIFETFTHVVPMDALSRNKLLPLTLTRENHKEEKSNLYYDVALSYFLPTESLPPRDEGITITRELYRLTDVEKAEPVSTAEVGEILRGRLVIGIPGQYNHVAVEDYIPAGFELVNFNLATEDQSLREGDAFTPQVGVRSGVFNRAQSYVDNLFARSSLAQMYGGIGYGRRTGSRHETLQPTHSESHDDRVFLYVAQIAPGLYEYEYFIRALVPGEFQRLPAKAEELYTPEVFGRTSGDRVTVSLPR